MVVIIVRYMEIIKITGSTPGFGKTLLSASYNIFLRTVLTFMFNPRAPAIAAVEHMEVCPCAKIDMHEVKVHAKKKEEHLHSAMSTVTLPLSPVQLLFYMFIVF